MYDHIRITLPYSFSTNEDLQQFCERFGLYNRDDKRGLYHNRAYKNLIQNYNVFININKPINKERGQITMSFSLHKFYNLLMNKEYQNYNDFDFVQANKAKEMFVDKFPMLDFSTAQVNVYEIGVNIKVTQPPIKYFEEIKAIHIQGKERRIIEDRHIKEYLQYGNHIEKSVRCIYLFYNKTEEAKSKGHDKVPNNLIRVEKDNKRINKGLMFYDLFTPTFQNTILQEFEKKFVDDIVYYTRPIPQQGMKKTDFELMRLINENGAERAKELMREEYKSKFISNKTYYNKIKKIDELSQLSTLSYFDISETAKELKTLLTNKIEQIRGNSVKCSHFLTLKCPNFKNEKG